MNIERHQRANQLLVEYAKALADLDEPLLALKALRHSAPAFYRDNPSKEMRAIHNLITSQIYTTEDYAQTTKDNIKPGDHTNMVDEIARGMVVRDFVKSQNEQGKCPVLYDLGPGDFWLPLSLNGKQLNFWYEFEGICDVAAKIFEQRARETGIKVTYERKGIDCFIACELIEHLHDPVFIRQKQLQVAPECSTIILSTPKYCFDGLDISMEKQQHFRVYTPREFCAEAEKLFPEYAWKFVDDTVMVLIGERQ